MSGISGVSGGGMMQGMGGMRRPDPAKMAEDLFAKLDTSSQGFIEKADLKTALDKVQSTSESSADDLFAQLDSDSDGKVTKQEFSDAIQKVSDELDSQMHQMRFSGAGEMPPPPPPPRPGGEAGLSKDELTSLSSEMASVDSTESAALAELADNFDKADTNGDGKVSFQESQAYRQSAETDDAGVAVAGTDANEQILKQIMKLMEAYGIHDDKNEGNALLESISTLV